MTAAPVCLIDASIYIFRYYFSLPDRWFAPATGFGTAAVYGYTGFLLALMERVRPRYLAACFDESLGSGFRHQLYPDYKASRALPDEALAFQLAACRKVTECLGIASFACQTYEADDLLGSLYRRCRRQRAPVAILTRDKDLGQLLRRDQDFLWDYAADQRHYAADIEQRFGVPPAALVDYLALVGDPGDDIPGVPGVGAKTAAVLLQAFGSIDVMLRRLDEVAGLPLRGASGLAGKLDTYREQMFLARQLATIVTEAPTVQSVRELRPKAVNFADFGQFCADMGWSKAPLKRLQTLFARDSGSRVNS